MTISVQQIATMLEKTWNPLELCESIKEQREDILEEIVDAKLEEQGFPKETNYKNIKWKLYCTHMRSFSSWAELVRETYIVGDSVDEIRTFFSRNDDQKMYLSNLKDFQFEVNFEETIEEWTELHPTTKTIANALEIDWMPDVVASELKINYEHGDIFEQRLRENLVECGFQSDVDISRIEYDVTVRNKMNFEDWAEIALSKYINSTLTKFRTTDEIKMYVQNQQYLDMIFSIKTMPEELEEQ